MLGLLGHIPAPFERIRGGARARLARFSQRMPCISVQFAGGSSLLLYRNSPARVFFRILLTRGLARARHARRCSLVSTSNSTTRTPVLGGGLGARARHAQRFSLADNIGRGRLGFVVVVLLRSFAHLLIASLPITQRGRLGGLTCAILKLERSCLHHIRGLGARGRHAPLVGVHIILKDDSGGIGLVVVGSPHQGVLHHPIFE